MRRRTWMAMAAGTVVVLGGLALALVTWTRPGAVDAAPVTTLPAAAPADSDTVDAPAPANGAAEEPRPSGDAQPGPAAASGEDSPIQLTGGERTGPPAPVQLGPPAHAEAAPAAVPAPAPGPVPASNEPQANLLQPIPGVPAAAPASSGEANAEPPRQVTVRRWPLGAPRMHETAPGTAQPQAGVDWSKPVPLNAAPGGPDAGEQLRPVPATAAKLDPVASAPVQAPPEMGVAVRPRQQSRPAPTPLVGTHPCVVEEGRTLLLPLSVRLQLEGARLRLLFVTPGPDHAVWLATAAGLEHWSERLERSSASAARVRRAQRLCFAQTAACPVDHGGHLQLPERLVEYAGLRQDVVLIGAGDHLELWDAQRWLQESASRDGAPSPATWLPAESSAPPLSGPGTGPPPVLPEPCR